MRWLISTTRDIDNDTSMCWNFNQLLSFVQICCFFYYWLLNKYQKLSDINTYLFRLSSLRYSETYFLINTAAMIAEIATAIATRMTITLRRDLEERLAAVSRSLLPEMESCSPRFAGFGWIWSKEIVSLSDDAISDEISRHECRIYFTLKMLRNKVSSVKTSSRRWFPFLLSLSVWSWKVNTTSFLILKVCSPAWISVSSFSFVIINEAVMCDISCINVTLTLDCSSHMLLLGIFQYVRNSVSLPCPIFPSSFSYLSLFFSRFLSFSSSLFLFSFFPFSFLSLNTHLLNLQNLETLTKLCTLLRAYHTQLCMCK